MMRLLVLRGLVALTFAVFGVGVHAPRAAELSFTNQSNGGITAIGDDLACVTNTYEPVMESAFDGFSLHDGMEPAIGETWYAHVLVSHPGNNCGGNANGIEILLPANTTFAISSDYPVFCALYSPYQLQTTVYYRQNQGCPQFPDPSTGGYWYFWAYSGSTAYPWTLVPGAYLELLIPVRSSTALSAQNLRFRVNPALGLYGNADVAVYVGDGNVIFRDDMDGITLIPDLCNISSCTVAP